MRQKWRSFKKPEGGYTLASLKHWAKEDSQAKQTEPGSNQYLEWYKESWSWR